MHELSSYNAEGSIPISTQPNNDGISCGIIVINAINHALFGDPLWTSEIRDQLRLHQYLDIVNDHLDYCSQVSLCIYLPNVVCSPIAPLALKPDTRICEPGLDVERGVPNQSSGSRKRTLPEFAGFHVNTKDQRAMQIERQFEEDREKLTKLRKLEERLKEVKKVNDREDAKERKQKLRAKKKEAEVVSGVRDRVTGKKLAAHPEVHDGIVGQLTALRESGVIVTASTVRGIMVAHIQHSLPGLFAVKTKVGTFSCSIRFVRSFLRRYMRWSMRKATKAAQKIPLDAEAKCRASFLRQALSIRNYHILPELRVNIDQTQVVLQDTGNRTYDSIGSTQVQVVGKEEKRAFTRTMYLFIDDILMPYLRRQKEKLKLPKEQECILQLDPCDVGMQRLMKIVVRRSQQEDVVEETLGMLRKGVKSQDIKLDNSIKTLRNRSVRWLVRAFQEINDPRIVKKAFSMCRLQDPQYNLSQESLTSAATLQLLRELHTTEPKLCEELNINGAIDSLGEELDEDLDSAAQDLDDVDTSIPLDVIKSHLFDNVIPAGYTEGEGGGLERTHDETCADSEAQSETVMAY
ncbi:hypothetical protein BC835DRAFT_1279846 [Cytidiella melzeri]|nr:hypothetical protein BC835DRAFT_1279846 [Cytidiella melzeri]